MNDEKKTFSQIFTPPEGYYGQICVCSAMSADCSCVENILTIFSGGKKNNTRAFDRKPSLFLMLDKGHPILNDSGIIHGLCQLGPKTNGVWDKVKVQHAKVAVMQFGRDPYGVTSNNSKEDLIWRYVVCTGNWTDASAKHQIEMIWNEDIASICKKQQNQQIADLMASANFLLDLKTLYSCSKPLWNKAQNMFDKIISFGNRNKDDSIDTRFFSTLPELHKKKDKGSCILAHISDQFSHYRGWNKRNYIIAGSGFFEEAKGNMGGKPEVFKRIEKDILYKMGGEIEKKLVVNPKFVGKIALWKKGCDWNFFSAKDPAGENRKLHAKYIFVAEKDKKNKISNGLLYLGSGNLSINGFLSSFGKNSNGKPGSGNIEAGIVIKTDDIFPNKEEKLHSVLLVGEDVSMEEMESGLLEGDEELPKSEIRQMPVLAINCDGQEKFSIEWNPDYVENRNVCSVKISTDQPHVICVGLKSNIVFYWKNWNIDECPRYQWLEMEVDGIKCIVPMLNQEGVFLPYCSNQIESFDEVVASLNDFPKNVIMLDDASIPPEDPVHRIQRKAPSSTPDVKTEKKKYLYGTAMELIERIASYNNEYFPEKGFQSSPSNQELIGAWVTTIETLLDNLPPSVIKEYSDLKIDFVSVLKNPNGFCPSLNAKHRKIWDDFVDRWVKKWKLDSKNNNLWIDV